MIKVEVKCSGHGCFYWTTVELSKDEIEALAIKKLRETDASPNMDAIETTINITA